MVKRVTVILSDPSYPTFTHKDGKFTAHDFESLLDIKEALSKIKGYRFQYLDSHTTLIEQLLKHPPAFVLNLCDEGFRNIPAQALHVPALLDMLTIPYTGAAPSTLAICRDKTLVRSMAHTLGIPVPIESYCSAPSQIVPVSHRYPVIVKPNLGDGSIGITQHAVAYNPSEFLHYIDFMRKRFPDTSLLIQEFLQGPEYTVGIIGNSDKLEILPILEIDYSKLPEELPRILCYEAKWIPKSIYWKKINIIPAKLSDRNYQRLTEYSLKLFKRLRCRDYARIDFRADVNGNIRLLELNPNPRFHWLSLMGNEAGMTYSQLLHKILMIAETRSL